MMPAMFSTLHRYLLREITAPFLLGMGTFTAVLLMGRMLKLAEMVVAKGVPLSDVLRLVVYLLPYFSLVTIPMAFLLAVLLAFSRLSADSEITAMKATGISLYGLLPPVLVYAAAAFLLTTGIALYAFPWGNTSFKKLLYQVIENRVTLAIKERVFSGDFPGVVLYVDRYREDDHRLSGVMIQDERDPLHPTTIFAREGTISSDPASRTVSFNLTGGSIHQNLASSGYRLLAFQDYQLTIDLSRQGKELVANELDMTLGELLANQGRTDLSKKLLIDIRLELQRRFALPFACFVFALLAVPLGIQNQRSGKAAGFSLSIGVLLLYYIVLSATKTLGERELLHPAAAVWLPNLVFLAAGVLLFRQTAAERRLLLLDRLAALPGRLAALVRRRWSRP
jgi:lipopolysaccharide export system permease protein